MILLLSVFFLKRVEGKRTDDLVVGPQFEFGWKKLGVFSFDSFDPRHTGRVTEDDYAVLAKYYGFPVLSMRDAFWILAAQKARRFLPLTACLV